MNTNHISAEWTIAENGVFDANRAYGVRCADGADHWVTETKSGRLVLCDSCGHTVARRAIPEGPYCAACGDATCTASDAHHTVTSFTDATPAPVARRVVRTTNPNGTYRYEIDGDVIYKASKVLYTHVSSYSVGTGNNPILFHKTESAANKATGYRNNGWVKTGMQVIEDGDTAPLAPVVDAPAPAPRVDLWETHEGVTHAYDADGNRVIEISERVRDTRWTVATNVRHWTVLGDGITRHGVLASGTADGLRAAKKAALAAWADIMATPAPAPRKAPRNRAKVVPNQGAPTHLVGRQGRVLGKHTGDDGKLYVDVDFGDGGEWPFLVHELDLV